MLRPQPRAHLLPVTIRKGKTESHIRIKTSTRYGLRRAKRPEMTRRYAKRLNESITEMLVGRRAEVVEFNINEMNKD